MPRAGHSTRGTGRPNRPAAFAKRLEPSGTVWNRLEPSGNVWKRLELNGAWAGSVAHWAAPGRANCAPKGGDAGCGPQVALDDVRDDG